MATLYIVSFFKLIISFFELQVPEKTTELNAFHSAGINWLYVSGIYVAFETGLVFFASLFQICDETTKR